MRIIYYFHPKDELWDKVLDILSHYSTNDIIKVYDNHFLKLRERYSLPLDIQHPELVSIKDGKLEGVWVLTNDSK